ncbi:SCO2400 family protein, partial [Streptomyces aureus]|uniref:SCO2400 family protein n=1 Tax=Streptomyces aureus TaxID=193461 RepID=UPI003F5D5052
MDYCHACRRHLNGALACAGCGTPVEELRYETPHMSGRPAEPVQAFPSAPPVEPAGPRAEYGVGPGYGAGPDAAPAPEHVYELDVLEPPRPAPGGRRAARVATQGRSADRGRSAARKGRRARSRRGRTVLVGTLGLVLAAGSLSLARLAMEDPEQAGAATAV